MGDGQPIMTLDVIEAQTNRAKCHNCKIKIVRGSLKGMITVDVEVQDKRTGAIKAVQQNRSLCENCVRTNLRALGNHLNSMAKKIGM